MSKEIYQRIVEYEGRKYLFKFWEDSSSVLYYPLPYASISIWSSSRFLFWTIEGWKEKARFWTNGNRIDACMNAVKKWHKQEEAAKVEVEKIKKFCK